MKNYAFIRNNIVLLVDQIDESSYVDHIRSWDAIIDIDQLSPAPKVGWILKGNLLVPVDPDEQQKQQQIFGAQLSIELVNKMGSRNLSLAAQGQVVNVASLLSALGSIKALIETGALKTARSSIQYYVPSFPAYADILNEAITRITSFLQSKGWD